MSVPVLTGGDWKHYNNEDLDNWQRVSKYDLSREPPSLVLFLATSHSSTFTRNSKLCQMLQRLGIVFRPLVPR